MKIAAKGANAVNWFYPDHHDDGHLNYRNAPINQLGEHTATFDWMGQEVRVFQHQFGRLFAQFTFERRDDALGRGADAPAAVEIVQAVSSNSRRDRPPRCAEIIGFSCNSLPISHVPSPAIPLIPRFVNLKKS